MLKWNILTLGELQRELQAHSDWFLVSYLVKYVWNTKNPFRKEAYHPILIPSLEWRIGTNPGNLQNNNQRERTGFVNRWTWNMTRYNSGNWWSLHSGALVSGNFYSSRLMWTCRIRWTIPASFICLQDTHRECCKKKCKFYHLLMEELHRYGCN